MARKDAWTREQQLVAFHLYCTLPFGRLHRHNPEIIALAKAIGRTSNALAMKACNFASLDPKFLASGRKGLSNASDADEALWADFERDSTLIAEEATRAFARAARLEVAPDEDELPELKWVIPSGPTEGVRLSKVRLVQRFFRDAVLISYDHRCAVTGLAIGPLLCASHIVPWRENTKRRADPRNGILLSALLDRAFDGGFITFDEEHRLLLGPHLDAAGDEARSIKEYRGARLQMPGRFEPSPDALAFHREHVFEKRSAAFTSAAPKGRRQTTKRRA